MDEGEARKLLRSGSGVFGEPVSSTATLGPPNEDSSDAGHAPQ